MDAATQTNRFGNWIADSNRFGLLAPPDWVLEKLANFDARLVVIPSRFSKQYLLAIRRHYTAGLGDVAMLDNKHPDTNMLYAHGLLPIAPLKFTNDIVKWEAQDVDGLLDLLRARDTWRFTGGPDGNNQDAAWQAVEDAEKSAKRKQRAGLKEHFKFQGRDAWRSMMARIGARSKRASDYHGVARSQPTGSGSTQ
jgi:hypothetical protein